MNSQVVKAGYNIMAKTYLKEREKLKTDKYIRKLLKLIGKDETILDLGCGGGYPVDNLLIKAGHKIIGIDIAEKQIELAKMNCPAGEYEVLDILNLRKNDYCVDAVIMLYTMFHLPRNRHLEILKIVESYLNPGGILLITMGDCDFEGEHQLYGTRMWSSQYGPQKNLEIMKEAGFDIMWSEIDTTGNEKHQIIMAVKR